MIPVTARSVVYCQVHEINYLTAAQIAIVADSTYLKNTKLNQLRSFGQMLGGSSEHCVLEAELYWVKGQIGARFGTDQCRHMSP